MSKTDQNRAEVKELVPRNRKISVCEVANMLGISFGLVLSI
jgi:hypothetical protein